MRKKKFSIVPPAPQPVVSFARQDYLAATLAAFIALAVYICTLAPTITGDDSGEFITAAYTLGIPHPPGYPLWCMLGKLFTIVAPFESIATRVAFMSSFFGAATCFVLALIIIRLTANRLAALAASATFAVSLEFWKWNVVAETYSLNAFLMLVCLLLVLEYQETHRNTYLYWFAFVYGLGLCNHHTTHFLGPVFALFIIISDFNARALPPACGGDRGGVWHRLRTYALMLAIAFAIWFVIHLYLPIRAAADPYVNFSAPTTLERIWGVITRKPFTQGFVEDPRSFGRFLTQCLVFGKQYIAQFTPVFALLPLLGVYPLWKRNRAVAFFVVGTFFYVAVGTILIINPGFDRSSVWFNSKFWVPAYMMATILIGSALAWLATLKLPDVIVPALALALFILPLVSHYKDNDKSHYYYADDYARNLANTLEPNAYLFSSADFAHFGIYYLQAVENYRTDITIINKYGYIDEDINKQLPSELQNTAGPWVAPSATQKIEISKWLHAQTGRPVYHTAGLSNAALHGVKMVNTGITQQMLLKDAPIPQRDYWSKYTWHNLDFTDLPDDFTAENIASEYHFARARDYLAANDLVNAKAELEQAIAVADRHVPLLNNLGIYCGENHTPENNLIDLAVKCFQSVLDTDPRDEKALRNLGVALGMTNDYPGARDAFERLVHVHEFKYGKDHFITAGSLTNLGSVYLALNDFQSAKNVFLRALNIDKTALGPGHPNTARDKSNLALALQAIGNTETAAKLHTEAVDTLMKTLGADHPFTQKAQQNQFIESMEN